MVLRFINTNIDIDDLYSFVMATYERRAVRQSDGAYVGGAKKLEQMQQPNPSIVAVCNPTLNLVLVELARLCHKHISSIDFPTLDALYGVPEPDKRPSQSTLWDARRATVEDIEAAPDFKDEEQYAFFQDADKQVPGAPRSGAPSVAVVNPTTWDPYADSPLKDHSALGALLKGSIQATRWNEDWKSNEDLFKKCKITPPISGPATGSKRTSTYVDSDYASDRDRKRQKGASGQRVDVPDDGEKSEDASPSLESIEESD